VQFLASDLLEGRGVGQRGGDLAVAYIATQLELAGAKPLAGGSFLQPVPLTSVAVEPGATLEASAQGKRASFAWLDQFVGTSQLQEPLAAFDAEAVFVGHGISAPEFGWDDYRGTDVKGKIVVLFTNEPPSDDPKFFGGKALTYYGRWSYKYEEALRRGALGAVILHTTPTAGYGWQVVRGSWGREEPQVRRKPGAAALAFTGWVTTEAGEQLVGLAGRTVPELLKLADTRGFKPFPLGIRLRGKLNLKLREIETHNVAAIVRGGDPAVAGEAVVFSAHWDHLGLGEAVNGDRIYNGAVDNATGCAMLIEMARAWAALEPKPKRSAVFLAVTSEESGLLGSKYYAENPLIPTGKTAANLNFDAFYPFGRTKDVVMNGAERTTLWPLVEQVARRFQLTIKPDPRPEQGSYFRSDHFSMARVGVPAFSINMGDEFEGRPAGTGAKIFAEFNTRHYHQPSDEIRAEWDFAGMEHLARFGMALGLEIANQEKLPTWQPGDPLLPLRQQSGVR
jgi:Zn-dependent M28 family amino/carboxypeptidase